MWKSFGMASLVSVAVALAPLWVSGCGGSSSSERENVEVISAPVSAAGGGTFSDASNQVTIVVPPSAMSADALLKVTRLASSSTVADAAAISSEYEVSLLTADGARVTLREPIELAMVASRAPQHPELGEIGRSNTTDWERLRANFFRASDKTVIGLLDDPNGVFRGQVRSLRAVSGDTVDSGRELFMYETFGNEDFFGGVLGLADLLNEVPPAAAVGLGAQVDLNRVPEAIVSVMVGDDLDAKSAALDNPAITRALIKAGAVIGVKGVYATEDPADDVMISAGLTCALCHVTVTPTEFTFDEGVAALPIGEPRFDGVPNNAMDAGAILALTPFAVDAGQDTVDFLNSWGPGRFDVRSLPDNPLDDGVPNPTTYPPLWNFVDLEEQGYLIGWDGLFESADDSFNGLTSISEAAYDLILHGNGAFGMPNGSLPPELSITPPQELVDALVAAEEGAPGNDVVPVQKLIDVRDFMRSMTSPAPGEFDEARAESGFELFFGNAGCADCHSTPELTGPGVFSTITEEPPAGALSDGIRVPGLRGVGSTAPYFHDGSASTLDDAVSMHGAVRELTSTEQRDLVEFLKSL